MLLKLTLTDDGPFDSRLLPHLPNMPAGGIKKNDM